MNLNATTLGTIRPEQLLGKGAEGEVWSVQDHPSLALKLFHGLDMSQATQHKLTILIANQPENIKTAEYRLAWPMELVTVGKSSTTPGYIMPRLAPERHLEIGAYLNISRRNRRLQQRRTGYTFLHLLTLAHNLARMTADLHEQGHIIGDLSSRNVRASDRCQIALIDIDSIQTVDRSSGQIYRCPVGTPEYSPPERQDVAFDTVERTIDDDRFALAVMIYQLLFQGRHPFTGIPASPATISPDIGIAGRIQTGSLIHEKEQNDWRPTNVDNMIWTATPFKRQFRKGLSRNPPRYAAHQWAADIQKAAQTLKNCPNNRGHLYFGSRACTWCRYTKLTGTEPFAAPEQRAMPTSNTARSRNAYGLHSRGARLG